MRRYVKIIVLLFCVIFYSNATSHFADAASNNWKNFDSQSSRGKVLPPNYIGYHYDDKPDWSQGWMHWIQLKDGAWLTLLFGVANLGPYDKVPSVGIMYTNPNGKKYLCRDLWTDNSRLTEPTQGKYWVGLNKTFFGGKYPNYFIKINEDKCQGELNFYSKAPSFTQGSGKVSFSDDGTKYWQQTIFSPKAKVSGFIKFKEAKVDVDGDALLEEVTMSVLVPTISDRWYVFRTVSGPYLISIFNIIVDKKNYGDGAIKSMVVTKDNNIIMGTTDFQYTPVGGKFASDSGYTLPESFNLSSKDGNVSVNGKVKINKTMHSINTFNYLPKLVKSFAGLVYGTPWQYVTNADYDFVIKEGNQETHLNGLGYQEVHFYDK